MSTVNALGLSLIPIGTSQPVRSIPSAPTARMPNADGTRTCHLDSTALRDPRYHVNLGISWIASSQLQISRPWKPRMSGFRYFGSVPPVHARISGPDQIGKLPSRGFVPRPPVFPLPEIRCPEFTIPDATGSASDPMSLSKGKKKSRDLLFLSARLLCSIGQLFQSTPLGYAHALRISPSSSSSVIFLPAMITVTDHALFKQSGDCTIPDSNRLHPAEFPRCLRNTWSLIFTRLVPYPST
jgi:hypothetical protein